MSAASAAIQAARHVIERTAEYLNHGVSFAVETTLSGRGRLELIGKAKSRGYATHLVFIGLDSPERCITRIRNRAAQGGHPVADADVRRRYSRSLVNAAQAILAVDTARFYDNSGDGIRVVLMVRRGAVVWQAEPLPAWVRL